MLLPTLYLLSFLDAFCFVLVITSINPYVYSLGGSQFYLGVLGSLAALVNLIWSPIVGSLSDSLGRKTVLLQCIVVVLIGNLMSASIKSLAVFSIARILTSFGTQIGNFIRSLIDDNVPLEEEKMAAISRTYAIGGSCFIFASLASGFLSELDNGFNLIFYLISAIFTVSFVLVWFIVPASKPSQKQPKTNKSLTQEMKSAITNLTNINWDKYWDLFTIKLTVDLTLMISNFSFMAILLNLFGISGKNLGYVFSSISIMGIVTNLTLPKLKSYMYKDDDSGLRRLFHGCLLLMYSILGQYFCISSFPLYYIHLIPMGAARVFFETTFTELILGRAGSEEKGTIMGAFDTTISISGLLAPILSGIISEVWSLEVNILSSTVPLAVGTAVAYYRHKKIKTQ